MEKNALGGLRYLEFAELGLVRESLHEREILLQIAPHLVRPLPLLIPIYSGSRRGPIRVRAGMWLYDLLSAGKSLPAHRMLDDAAARAELPGIEAANLRAAARYHDAQATFPERLVLENLLDARRAGADVRSRVRDERVLVESGRVIGVSVRDLGNDKVETLSAPLVVNAAGPWVDHLLGSFPGRRLRRFIGGSKGAHIVVDRLPGMSEAACYAEAGADGRPFFVIPWNGLALICTTDIAYDGVAALLAVIVLRERIHGRNVAALVVGFIGAMIVIRPGIVPVDTGSVLILISALGWAGMILIVKRLTRTDSSITITAWMVVLMSPMALVPALFVWVCPTWGDLFWLVVLGLVGTLGQLAVTQAFRLADTTTVLPIDFTKLIWAALLGYLVFREVPSVWTWVGGSAIFVCGMYIAVRERRAGR